MLIQRTKRYLIDLNSILRLFIFIFVTFLLFIKVDEKNQYVNLSTFILGGVLALQNFIFLIFEKLKRNPLLLLLVFQNVFFFMIRILSLNYTDFSTPFEQNNCSATDVHYALIFIFFANISLFLGLISFPGVAKTKLSQVYEVHKKYLILVPVCVSFFMSYYSSKGFISLINSLFINLGILILMIIVYLIYKGKHLNKSFKYLLLLFIIAYVIMQTAYGSRAALISVVLYSIYALLAVYGFFKVKIIHILLAGILIPIMIIFFLFATYMRPQLSDATNKTLPEIASIYNNFNLKGSLENDAQLLLTPVFDRIGFLDYSATTIKNADKYAPVFNITYYFKSIVDNILSPGFDIFDVPRVSNATSFIYYGNGPITKTTVTENYQSDQFCFYGEYYALFGKWFSLIPIFLTGVLFKFLYERTNPQRPYLTFVNKAFILSTYYLFLNSFGLDWILLDIVGYVFTFSLFQNFFKFKLKTSIV